jgi:hypothetical protein
MVSERRRGAAVVPSAREDHVGLGAVVTAHPEDVRARLARIAVVIGDVPDHRARARRGRVLIGERPHLAGEAVIDIDDQPPGASGLLDGERYLAAGDPQVVVRDHQRGGRAAAGERLPDRGIGVFVDGIASGIDHRVAPADDAEAVDVLARRVACELEVARAWLQHLEVTGGVAPGVSAILGHAGLAAVVAATPAPAADPAAPAVEEADALEAAVDERTLRIADLTTAPAPAVIVADEDRARKTALGGDHDEVVVDELNLPSPLPEGQIDLVAHDLSPGRAAVDRAPDRGEDVIAAVGGQIAAAAGQPALALVLEVDVDQERGLAVHVAARPALAAVAGAQESRRLVGKVGAGGKDVLAIGERVQTADRLRRIGVIAAAVAAGQVPHRLPGMAVRGLEEDVGAGAADPAAPLVDHADAAQPVRGEVRLLVPVGAAVFGLEDLPIAVDGPADRLGEEIDVVVAHDRRGRGGEPALLGWMDGLHGVSLRVDEAQRVAVSSR